MRSIADFSRDGVGVNEPKRKDASRSDGVKVIRYGTKSRVYGVN